ncbi:MAG: hypothetical protein D6712_07410, partial [Chloroflexi bacterium]
AQLLEQFSVSADMPYEESLRALYDSALAYQRYAVNCGYIPDTVQLEALSEHTLGQMDIAMLLQALAVGQDIDAIMAELESVRGDPIRGQLLYNGLEPAIDGSALSCTGCHNGVAAPALAGTWTRAVEVRLQDEALADYDAIRYLVESIVMPDAYVVGDYMAGLMPPFYGEKLDTQMLADLLAYLESQDQPIEGD